MKINEQYIKEYFKIKYIDKINDYERIANNENKNINNIKDSYLNKGGIDKYYCDKLGFDIDYLSEIKKYFNEFNTFYNSYYNNERKEIFQSFEIFKWFNEHKNKCGYCEITQSDLHKIKESRNGNFTLNKKKKRKNATLEIEQKDCTLEEYGSLENLIFACPLCNNAKSNLISEEDWRKYFVKQIKAYYKDILKQI